MRNTARRPLRPQVLSFAQDLLLLDPCTHAAASGGRASLPRSGR